VAIAHLKRFSFVRNGQVYWKRERHTGSRGEAERENRDTFGWDAQALDLGRELDRLSSARGGWQVPVYPDPFNLGTVLSQVIKNEVWRCCQREVNAHQRAHFAHHKLLLKPLLHFLELRLLL